MKGNMISSREQRSTAQDELEDSMWKLAMTTPLLELDTERLRKMYPEKVISTFLDLLTKDRYHILDKGYTKQKKILQTIRNDLYDEVSQSKAKFKRIEERYKKWCSILTKYQELEVRLKQNVVEIIPDEREVKIKGIVTDIEEMERLVAEENQRNELLCDELNKMRYSLGDDRRSDNETLKIQSAIENLKSQIERRKLFIDNQKRQIKRCRR